MPPDVVVTADHVGQSMSIFFRLIPIKTENNQITIRSMSYFVVIFSAISLASSRFGDFARVIGEIGCVYLRL